MYIASMLEWASRMGDEFLRQHAGNIMEWLGSPLLRGKLYPLLQLSPDEAFQLSQTAGGDFLQMLRLAEFKHTFEQFSKLGPDVIRILSFSNDGIEVGVEKSLAGQLYPGIQKGSIVEFEFSSGNIVLKGLLTYAEERALGDSKYLVFSFKAEERIPAVFELLKQDLQAIPGSQVEKSFGFNAFTLSNGMLSMDKSILGMDGAVRLSDGMVLRMDNPGIMLALTENPLETGTINRMLLTGSIGGTSVIVSEDGSVQALHAGSYLPAVVTTSALGLQLGLLAKPSGEALAISRESLLARGISDLSLLNVAYPNGETSTVIYTGGSLEIPTLSYPSGAFVGIQEVEMKVIWTSINQREFYGQILSTSQLLESILGKTFAEELMRALLLSGLTDSQVLDIANELARNVEWLKSLSHNRRIDTVRKITEYVKKGESAEEAIEKAKGECEAYVENLGSRMMAFYQSISDEQLANEVLDLLRHVLEAMGPDAARWLLDILEGVYSKALDESKGDKGKANDKLRKVVEEVLDYPESKMRNCMIATTKISQLVKLEGEALRKALEELLGSEGGEVIVAEFEKTIPEAGYIWRHRKFEKGLYLIRVMRKEDGKVFEWSTRKDEDSDVLNIRVPERFKEELVGKEVVVTIIKYDYSLHFKCKGPNFYFSPRDGLIVEGREIELESVKPRGRSKEHGASMVAKLKQRSIDGAEIYIAFFEDGELSIDFNEEALREGGCKAKLRVEGNLLIIEYEDKESIVPISVQEWKVGERYYLNITVKGKRSVGLVKELRKIFGYCNVEALRERIDKGNLTLVAYFDNRTYASCSVRELRVNVPGGAEVLEYIVIRPRIKPWQGTWELSDEEVREFEEAIKTSETRLGDAGRDKVEAVLRARGVPEIENVKEVYKKAYVRDEDGKIVRKIDLVVETEDGRFIVVEVKTITNADEIMKRFTDGAEQLEEYREEIRKYGLELRSRDGEIIKTIRETDIDAYVVFVLYPDLDEKVVKVIWGVLPKD